MIKLDVSRPENFILLPNSPRIMEYQVEYFLFVLRKPIYRYVFHQNVRFLPKLHKAVRDVLHGNPLLEIPRYEMRPMATITGNFTVRDASHGKPIPDIPRYEKRHTAISTGYSTVRDASYSNLSGRISRQTSHKATH